MSHAHISGWSFTISQTKYFETTANDILQHWKIMPGQDSIGKTKGTPSPAVKASLQLTNMVISLKY